MMFQALESLLTLISFLIAVTSIVINIIQFMDKKNKDRAARAEARTNYDNFFHMGRITTRIRDSNDISEIRTALAEMVGIIDAARQRINRFAQEHLGITSLKYEHPALPGQEIGKEVLYGLPPDKLKGEI